MLDDDPSMALPSSAAHQIVPFFDARLKSGLEIAGFRETGLGVNWVIRHISPLADTGKFPHFPPFRADAFVMRRP